MSITKFFEIRDSGTCLPLMVTKLLPINSDEDWLIKRGVGSSPYPIYLVTYLARCISQIDVYNWGEVGARTVKLAHQYIESNFEMLTTGSVIDIQVLIGETSISKISENPEKL